MTNEEKIRMYLACDECKYAQIEGYCDVCVAKKTAQPALERINRIIEKEKQEWVEKAAEYISTHTLTTMSMPDIHNMIINFRQVMKGE